jgi:hypothetical protein
VCLVNVGVVTVENVAVLKLWNGGQGHQIDILQRARGILLSFSFQIPILREGSGQGPTG